MRSVPITLALISVESFPDLNSTRSGTYVITSGRIKIFADWMNTKIVYLLNTCVKKLMFIGAKNGLTFILIKSSQGGNGGFLGFRIPKNPESTMKILGVP
jgi:hypothetical protein